MSQLQLPFSSPDKPAEAPENLLLEPVQKSRVCKTRSSTPAMSETVYLAIFKDENRTIVIEYKPVLNFGEYSPTLEGIEIVSVDIHEKPKSPWRERTEQRRKKPGFVKVRTDVLPIDI